MAVIKTVNGLALASVKTFDGVSAASIKTIDGLDATTGGFLPSDISGLTIWLKADAIVGLNDGDPVGTWSDSSGNGNDATQSTSGLKPLYKTGIMNGKPVVRFDASDDMLATAYSLSWPWTICLIAVNGTSGNHRDIASSSNNCVMVFNRNSDSGYAGGSQDIRDNTTTFPGSSAAFAIMTMNNIESRWYLNGTDRTDNTNQTSQNWGTVILGAGGPFPDPAAGDIAEVIIYNTVISSGDRANLLAYAQAKWGTP